MGLFKKKNEQEEYEKCILLVDMHLLEGDNSAYYCFSNLDIDQMDYIYSKGWRLVCADEYRGWYWFERNN